jgi:hypothetical protein
MRSGYFSALAACLAVACGDSDGPASEPLDSLLPEDAGFASNEPVACVDDLGCEGTQSCPTCDCQCEPFATVWEQQDVGEILWVSSDGDETYLLVGTAPYVVHLDAEGEIVDDASGPDLAWIEGAEMPRLYAAPDGTRVVFGLVAPVDGAGLHIERWSASGEKLFSGNVAGSYVATSMADDGTVTFASVEAIATFDTNDRFQSAFTRYDEAAYPPERLIDEELVAAGPTGSATWVRWGGAYDGSNYVNGGGLVDSHGLDGLPLGAPIQLDSSDTSREGCVIALDTEGSAALGCLVRNGQPQHWVARVRPEVGVQWQWEGSPGSSVSGVRVLSAVAMPAHTITATAYEDSVSIARYSAGGLPVGTGRYTTNTPFPSTLDGGAVVLPARGDDFFLLLWPHGSERGDVGRGFREVRRLRVAELRHGSRHQGEACGEGMDCESEVCCRAPAGSGTCGTVDGCPAGTACTTDADCGASSSCTLALGLPGPGLCWSRCTSDCESGFVCAAPDGSAARSLCLADCLTEGDEACSDFPEHVCTALTDASGFEARACVAREAP